MDTPLTLSSRADQEKSSDHNAVKCNVNVSRPPPPKVTVRSRNLREIDLEKFKTDIKVSSLPAAVVDGNDDPSELVQQYESVLCTLMDDHAPEKERSVVLRPHAPWYSSDLRESKQKKRRLERKWLKSSLEIDRQLYVDHCKNYRRMLDQAKCDHRRDLVAHCDDRKLFRLVERMSKPVSAPFLPDHDNVRTLANEFADFFNKKVNNLIGSINKSNLADLSVDLQHHCSSTFASFDSVLCNDVKRLIMKSATKSCPLDPIPTDLLKRCLDSLLSPITRIINTSLTCGYMPALLKVAQVVPLLKKPSLDRNELKNYRPISNLKFLFKTIERAVAAQLTDYLDEHNLHSPMQSAYRQFHSTETALLRVQNDLLRAVDQHQEAVLILLDFSAAFDTINHQILINRLRDRYGIIGTALDWFRSYLQGRVQAIRIGNVLSDEYNIEHGVPQGSVLGPLIFTMYTAPLGDILNAHGINYMTYADDTQLYITLQRHERLEATSRLETCLRDIKVWTAANNLILNDSKTEFVHISSKFVKTPVFPKLTIGDFDVETVGASKNLGVTIDHNLHMKDHVKNVVRSASFGIHKIGQLNRYLDRKSAERLVHAFVSSRLDFCNSLLFGLPDTEIRRSRRSTIWHQHISQNF